MKTVEMKLSSGDTILVEVEPGPKSAGSDRTKMSAADAVIKQFDFKDTVGKLKEPISTIMETFQQLALKPDKLIVEFSVKFSGEGGIIFASAKGEAGLVVKLEWAPKSTSNRPRSLDP